MFTFNTSSYQRCQQSSNDCFISVNGQKCRCNRSIAEDISPIIKRFYKEIKNKDSMFETEIPDLQSHLYTSVNSANSLNTMCILISKIFCGEEIIFQEDNHTLLHMIGEHFEIQTIISIDNDFGKYLKEINSSFKESIVFKDMIKLEKMLLFEMNETNIESKVNEYESLIKKIPIDCFIHFVINICSKNYKIVKTDNNEFIIEIIKNVNRIVPETLSHFISILFHKFVFINSVFICNNDKFNKKEINSLIHQMFVDGLMKDFNENIKIMETEITIPKNMEKYFEKKNFFFKLLKENNTQGKDIEINNQFDSFIDSIKNDNIDSFQNYIVNSNIDINSQMKNNITNRISFIDDDEKCSLIELSAFLGAIKCFTYLKNQQTKLNKSKLSYYAVAGGNPDIIHICEREECVFNERALDISIEYHKHQITKWLIETKDISMNERNLRDCIIYYNIKSLKYLIKKGINICKMVFYICESNNIILYKWIGALSKNYAMKLMYQDKKKTVLHIACEQNNVEIVKLLISKDNIDINSIFEVIIG